MKLNISNIKKNIATSVSASLFVMGICCMASAHAGNSTPATPGSLDTSFNRNGKVISTFAVVAQTLLKRLPSGKFNRISDHTDDRNWDSQPPLR